MYRNRNLHRSAISSSSGDCKSVQVFPSRPERGRPATGGPRGSNDVVPRDEKSKTCEESGANRTGRFFRGAVCSPIPARSYSSVSGSKIFTQIPRRRIKNIPFIQNQRCANRHFTCSTPLFSIFFFQVFPFFFSAAGRFYGSAAPHLISSAGTAGQPH